MLPKSILFSYWTSSTLEILGWRKFILTEISVELNLLYHHCQVSVLWIELCTSLHFFLHYYLFDNANVFMKSCLLYHLFLHKQIYSMCVGSKKYVRMTFLLTAILIYFREFCVHLLHHLLTWWSWVDHLYFHTLSLIFAISSQGICYKVVIMINGHEKSS